MCVGGYSSEKVVRLKPANRTVGYGPAYTEETYEDILQPFPPSICYRPDSSMSLLHGNVYSTLCKLRVHHFMWQKNRSIECEWQ